jgi:uroporphyrinogen decarboxylase
MNSRQRVVNSLNFKEFDRIPKDLGSHRSTGISAFVYPKLVKALGLPERKPRIFDMGQMLAIVETDVLDALGCDVIIVDVVKNGPFFTNAFIDEDGWEPYDFNGRLEAWIPKDMCQFSVDADGAIIEHKNNTKMPVNSYVFDQMHGGQPLLFDEELPKLDLDQFGEEFKAEKLITEAEAQQVADKIHQVRQSTDRAIHLSRGPFTSMVWAGGHAGLGVFPIICMQDPDYVHEYHRIQADVFLENMNLLLPKILEDVDVIDLGGGDWGTQNNSIVSPAMYEDMFAPYFRVLNQRAEEIAPHLRRLTHSCGAIYNLLDIMIDNVGIQVLNPVQWSAGGFSYSQWKQKVDGRMSLWGGGVNSQATLSLGTVDDVVEEVKQVVPCLAAGSGYVFNSIHNILAEIEPEKIIAMYQAVEEL